MNLGENFLPEIVTPPKRTPPRLLQVIKSEKINNFLQRIILSGPDLDGFPENCNGGHIKLFFPLPNQEKPVLPAMGENGPKWPPKNLKPIVRTFSLRKFDKISRELEVDFVRHETHGYASNWALSAKPGHYIGFAGPGGPCPLMNPGEYYAIFGDLSAIPAISSILEDLPSNSKGICIIEVPHKSAILPLNKPKNIKCEWLINPSKKFSNEGTLFQKIKEIDFSSKNNISAWVAGESRTVVSVKKYFKEVVKIDRKNLYAIPYWKGGEDEEKYHMERHKIMDEI